MRFRLIDWLFMIAPCHQFMCCWKLESKDSEFHNFEACPWIELRTNLRKNLLEAFSGIRKNVSTYHDSVEIARAEHGKATVEQSTHDESDSTKSTCSSYLYNQNALSKWPHYSFYDMFCFSDFAAINVIQSHLRIMEHIADDVVRQTDTLLTTSK